MSSRPLILICNDDGVYAPGIKHLWKALHELADLVVVAPSVEQSATGLSITIRRPLQLEKIEWHSCHTPVWSINGTPADCIKLALNVILPRPPDMIVSGINRGSNIGRNILYSGTVAAVMEGVMHDIPGIAFSASDYSDPNYIECESYIASLVEYVIKKPLPLGTFLNVNFPSKKQGKIKGLRFTRQGKEYWAENPEQRSHPFEGHPYYWLGGRIATFEEEVDSDVEWIKKGFGTVVPIKIDDLTNQELLFKEQADFNSHLNFLQSFYPEK